MIRLRWTDSRANDPDAPLDWRVPALILATLFFNLAFWYVPGFQVSPVGPLWLYLSTLISSAMLPVVLFYLGPASAACATKQSLFELAEASLGSWPAWVFRALCGLFSIVWIMMLTSTSVFMAFQWPGRLRPTSLELGALTAVLTIFLLFTGSRDLQTTGKLAFFTNKLGIALLIAALIRTRHGLPAIWHNLSEAPVPQPASQDIIFNTMAAALSYAAPWAVLAANFGRHCRNRREVALIGALGFVLPIIICAVVPMLAGAAVRGRFHNIAGALWGNDSVHYWPVFAMIAAIAMFGAIRCGVVTLEDSLVNFRHRWSIFGVVVLGTAVITPLILHPHITIDLPSLLNHIARPILIVAAILTADALIRHRPTPAPRFDPIAIVALLAAWAAPCFLPFDPYPNALPPLLTSYATAFGITLTARLIARLLGTDRRPIARHV